MIKGKNRREVAERFILRRGGPPCEELTKPRATGRGGSSFN